MNTFLFSDRPGSVYAQTVSGLQQLVADGPDFDFYRLHKVYPVEGISGQALSKAYSKHGYLAILTALDTRKAALLPPLHGSAAEIASCFAAIYRAVTVHGSLAGGGGRSKFTPRR